jgi:hypothetical protein
MRSDDRGAVETLNKLQMVIEGDTLDGSGKPAEESRGRGK